MALNDELRQRLVLVLQKQGTEAVDEVKAKINELRGEFQKSSEAFRDAFMAGNASILEFQASTKDLAAEHRELSKLIKEVEKAETQAAEAAGAAQRLRIEAYAAADRELEQYQKRLKGMAEAEAAAAENSAMEQHLRDQAELQAALQKMEERTASERIKNEAETKQALQAGTQAVRDRMQAVEQQRLAEGKALRDRAEMYARLERMAEQQMAEDRAAQQVTQQQIILDRQRQNSANGVAREMLAQAEALDLLAQSEATEAKAAAVATKTKEQLSQETAKMTSLIRNAGFVTLASAHAFQDAAQGGFSAVLNNIPLLSTSFANLASEIGGFSDSTRAKMQLWAPGIAGAISIVTVAGYELYQNWDKLERLFQGGVPRPILDDAKELERQLAETKKTTEELGKASSMTVEEVVRYREATEQVEKLNKALERKKQLDDLLNAQSRDSRERASGFREAVSSSGGSFALEELASALGNQAGADGKVWNPIKMAPTSAKEAAEDLFLSAGQQGDESSISTILKALRSAYGNNSQFANRVFANTPEGKDRAKEGEKHAKMLDDLNQKQIEEEQKAAEKSAQDEERRLTIEARQNETAWDQKRKMTEAWAKEQQDEADRLKRSQDREHRTNIKDRGSLDKLEKAATKKVELEDLARRFEAEGFAPGAAMEGARLARERINKGQNENAAMAMVYRQMIKSFAHQEQTLGLLGQATQIMMMLEQRDRMTQARLDMIQGKMNQTRSKRRSLQPTLPPN